uniref:Signaling mucin protein MSB2 n=1 Tax=Beauveria bassiana TaxID=176275 RepID=A0A6G6ABA8_BEABA|nr:signaling mucin protein MSB2 [Beauveria bassiana]
MVTSSLRPGSSGTTTIGSTTSQHSIYSSSIVTIESTSHGDKTTTQTSFSSHTTYPTNFDHPSAERSTLNAIFTMELTNPVTTVQPSFSYAEGSKSSNDFSLEGTDSAPSLIRTTEPAISGDVSMVQGSHSERLTGAPDSATVSTAATDVSTAMLTPSMTRSRGADETRSATTITSEFEPSPPATSTQFSGVLPSKSNTPTDIEPTNENSVYSTSSTMVAQSTADTSTRSLSLTRVLSPTTDPTAIENIAAPQQDQADSSKNKSALSLSTTMVTDVTAATNPRTVEHAVAFGSTPTVQSSLSATTLTPSADATRVGVVGYSATTSKIVMGSDTSRSWSDRTSATSVATLSIGGVLPTTILTQASQAPAQPTGQLQTPQGLPHIILPNNSSGFSASGDSLIQLGFLFPLNYVFVSQNLQAAAQIFEVLPRALAHGTVQPSAIEVARLVPYDTQATAGYITTIAKLYFPKVSVNQLQKDILDSHSAIYTKGGDLERNLTALIDVTIKITDDNGSSDCALSCAASSGTANSSKQKGVTAGAVVGSAAFCGVLGLGVFQIYRRRGSAFAAAWLFNNRGKGQLKGSRISRPVNSENSLGWNRL